MSRDFLNPEDPIDKHGAKLPHWQQGEVMQFVTFRLGDSIPREKLQHWKSQRDTWISTHPQPWSEKEITIFHPRFTFKLEKWLYQGEGSRLFRRPNHRQILEDVMMMAEGSQAHHHAWVIMPNHVHLLFKPLASLEKLIQIWKGTSARKLEQGPIWQRNYRDTLIRDHQHFANAVRYIRRNPSKANLSPQHYTLWQSERALLIP
ncbi:MAG: transposase [Luteolibacter sp.]